MDHIANLRATYKLLGDHIDAFTEMLFGKGELKTAVVYAYPAHTDDDIAQVPDSITLTPVCDQAALLLALDSMKQNTIRDDQSGRIVPRLPGAIVYHHPEPLECIGRLERINELKNELADVILAISPDKDVRFDVVKDALPLLIKKVATRHVIYANRPVKSVSFSWAHRYAGKSLTKPQVEDMLAKSLMYSNKHTLSDPRFGLQIEEDMLTISRLPAHSRFVIRREIRVTPMLNLNYEKDSAPYLASRPSSKTPSAVSPKNYVAHSPVFIFEGNPRLYPFESYAGRSGLGQQGARDTLELIIPRLHLYLKSDAIG
jgi:DNA replication terminus site-binding protein